MTYLPDTSAWHRARHPQITPSWLAALESDRLATTGPVRLEVLYSARSAEDYTRVKAELDALVQLPCGTEAVDRAEAVQSALAAQHALHHRSVKIPDLLIAAVAELAGATVWHYDEDYDRIAAVTRQAVEWIAPRGALH